MNMTTKRISISLLVAAAGLATAAVAAADPVQGAEGKCEGHGGKGKAKGAFFKTADKNSDGFLTKEEVGEQRWERIKAADANRDNKVTKPELKAARKDGKLPGKKA
jgi:hypothetical protein